jgi:hypothetical protein
MSFYITSDEEIYEAFRKILKRWSLNAYLA